VLSVAVTPLAPVVTGVRNVTSEPALSCYVFAACRGSQAPTLRVSLTRRGRLLRVTVSTLEGLRLAPVPAASVTLGSQRKATSARGVAVFTIRPGHTYRLAAMRPGCNSATGRVRT
jgi:hypothetical protein